MRHCVILLRAIDEEARATSANQWTTATFFYVHYISGGEGLSQMIRLRYTIGCFQMGSRTLYIGDRPLPLDRLLVPSQA